MIRRPTISNLPSPHFPTPTSFRATAQYDVHLWPDGFSFLEGARALGSACALLDIRMPDLSGLDVHAALGKIGAPIATIILTGHGDVATAVHALRAGATNFLAKPIESEAQIAAVEVGKASVREGVFQDVKNLVVAETLKKTKRNDT